MMEKEKISLLQRFIIWRENKIKEKQFILILSFLVGIFTAIAALLLKFFIHTIQNFLTDNLIRRRPTTCIWFIRWSVFFWQDGLYAIS